MAWSPGRGGSRWRRRPCSRVGISGTRTAPRPSEGRSTKCDAVHGLQQLHAAHPRLLASDEDLARAVPDSEARLLRRARTAYEGAADSAARLYAFLGDALTQQSLIASERLTLVATIFLPLTVITAFFGMNFGWMVERIGTATAFVLLGLVAPVLLTAAISLIIRRLTGPEL
jgi:hypothetical protein